jgi:hypothetical protein
MSRLDNPHVASAATNVINPLPGGVKLEKTTSHNDSITKAEYEHNDDIENDLKPQDPVGKADHFGTNTLYTLEETKLVRKLDWHIMPIVFAMYFMNKLDQNAIANARLDGFEKDLGLVGNQFNVCVSVLYAGYTLIQASIIASIVVPLLTLTDSLQHAHVHQKGSTVPVDVLLDDVSDFGETKPTSDIQGLGRSLCSHGCGTELSRCIGCSSSSRFLRSTFLPRSNLYALTFLHTTRDRHSSVDPVQ